jgi:hypothetical protein
MVQDMHSMEASCLLYVKVGMINHLKYSQISLVTFNKVGIVRPMVQHDLIVTVSFMYYHGNSLGQTSADIISLKE